MVPQCYAFRRRARTLAVPASPAARTRSWRGSALAARGEAADQLLLDGAHLRRRRARRRACTVDARRRGRRRAADRPEIARCSSSAASGRRRTSPWLAPAGDGSRQPRPLAERHRRPRRTARAGDADGCSRRPPPLVVVALDVQDPGNLGAIVRVAEAAGATGVVAAGACADPFGWKALRGSMGSALRLPVATVADASARPSPTRAGTAAASSPRRRAADGRSSTIDLRGADRRPHRRRRAGPRPDARRAGRRRTLTIPMQAPVESLNVAVAAALILYEARRQTMHGAQRDRSTAFQTKPSGDAGAIGAAARRADAAADVRRVRRPGGSARARQAAARGHRARSAAVDHPLGTARHRQDHAGAHHRGHDAARSFVVLQRRAGRHQGDPRGDGRGRAPAPHARAGARSSSSTKFTASTRRSRTRSCPASKPATSSSSARRPRIRRSR